MAFLYRDELSYVYDVITFLWARENIQIDYIFMAVVNDATNIPLRLQFFSMLFLSISSPSAVIEAWIPNLNSRFNLLVLLLRPQFRKLIFATFFSWRSISSTFKIVYLAPSCIVTVYRRVLPNTKYILFTPNSFFRFQSPSEATPCTVYRARMKRKTIDQTASQKHAIDANKCACVWERKREIERKRENRAKRTRPKLDFDYEIVWMRDKRYRWMGISCVMITCFRADPGTHMHHDMTTSHIQISLNRLTFVRNASGISGNVMLFVISH